MPKDTMKRFNASKVRALGNLQSKSEREKSYAKRVYRAQLDAVKFATVDRAERADKSKPLPRRDDYKPAKVRGRSGTRLDPAVRELVAKRNAAREVFFAGV